MFNISAHVGLQHLCFHQWEDKLAHPHFTLDCSKHIAVFFAVNMRLGAVELQPSVRLHAKRMPACQDTDGGMPIAEQRPGVLCEVKPQQCAI